MIWVDLFSSKSWMASLFQEVPSCSMKVIEGHSMQPAALDPCELHDSLRVVRVLLGLPPVNIAHGQWVVRYIL